MKRISASAFIASSSLDGVWVPRSQRRPLKMLLSPSAGNYEIRVMPATRRSAQAGCPFRHLQISAIALCPPGGRARRRGQAAGQSIAPPARSPRVRARAGHRRRRLARISQGLQHRASPFSARAVAHPGSTSFPNSLRVRFDGVNCSANFGAKETHDLRLYDGQSVAAPQVAVLRKHGAGKVFREVASGAKTDPAHLRRALDQLDAGEVLMVTRLGLLAFSDGFASGI
jgi:hypothetical protein